MKVKLIEVNNERLLVAEVNKSSPLFGCTKSQIKKYVNLPINFSFNAFDDPAFQDRYITETWVIAVTTIRNQPVVEKIIEKYRDQLTDAERLIKLEKAIDQLLENREITETGFYIYMMKEHPLTAAIPSFTFKNSVCTGFEDAPSTRRIHFCPRPHRTEEKVLEELKEVLFEKASLIALIMEEEEESEEDQMELTEIEVSMDELAFLHRKPYQIKLSQIARERQVANVLLVAKEMYDQKRWAISVFNENNNNIGYVDVHFVNKREALTQMEAYRDVIRMIRLQKEGENITRFRGLIH